ncbi:MAG: hypothetical protein K2H22_09325 [Muribaculaceae bacterium]|nr:hypothetical protein [Muribaculaceae bacterium]
MSKNIIHTVGQHVFKYDPPEYTENGVPVLAKNPEDKDEEKRFQFLGEGYYFWDDNINRAHKWGKTHYKDKYLIMEIPLSLQGNRFLDLVGSRADLMTLVDVLKETMKEIPNLKLGAFFHMMQTMEKYEPGTWPYSIIRALNVKSRANKISFNHVLDSNMLLNPEIIICFTKKMN